MENLSVTHQTLIAMWDELRGKITGMAKKLTEEQLEFALNGTTIKALLEHTAEAEFLFAEWYLGKEQPVDMASPASLADQISLLEMAHKHVTDAIKALTEEQLNIAVEGRMGASTPVQAVSRLMYHAGMHAGQIAFIKKANAEN